MLKEIKYLIFIVIIGLFLFFTGRYYFSDENIKKSYRSYKDIDEKITRIEGFALSSPYGDGKSLGQPLGVKSVGFIKVYSSSSRYGLGETYSGVYAPELIKPITNFLEKNLVLRKIPF